MDACRPPPPGANLIFSFVDLLTCISLSYNHWPCDRRLLRPVASIEKFPSGRKEKYFQLARVQSVIAPTYQSCRFFLPQNVFSDAAIEDFGVIPDG